MITRDMKISKMLESYPDTLDVLIKSSPHFGKLKNKVLRKALASRVNIEHAASIAGIDLNNLLIELNKAVNPDASPQFTDYSIADEKLETEDTNNYLLARLKNKSIVKLDVRPVIESGNDPFLDIMTKVKTLKVDEIFQLINSFEPIPLYSVMERKGYEHVTIKKPDEFNVFFYKKATARNEEIKQHAGNEKKNEYEKPEEVIEIDVRELEPPEPMLRVLETLPKLGDNSVLLVHHHRDPLMLYEKLEERGFKGVAHQIRENYYKVIITKQK